MSSLDREEPTYVVEFTGRQLWMLEASTKSLQGILSATLLGISPGVHHTETYNNANFLIDLIILLQKHLPIHAGSDKEKVPLKLTVKAVELLRSGASVMEGILKASAQHIQVPYVAKETAELANEYGLVTYFLDLKNRELENAVDRHISRKSTNRKA